MNLFDHLPKNLRDTDVVAVEVVAPFKVRVTHRDGTRAVHVFDPEDFRGDYEAIGTPAVFATAQAVDGRTLGWDLGGDLVYDLCRHSLWLHARGFCDGSHDLSMEVER
ncbi:hypothetical protein PP568_06670 [Mycobacteroides abscessus]|uniref:Protein of uncharacterized function (DUF2442) n=1 Tax=Mycobacteroides abscessus subsp. abscessus TaxID=1185650 RepID=A0AB38D3M7_9MYCO|nr:hypothetical protein [Mycobacteroides abscessus]MBE5419536.1 hypothetical protein [Mycobacteroides abscessus]MBE5455765.1 hypothetical protein [Mycobacteroides abscessus]MBN7463493.1 hypothetical protein [Mycobacteroides abscessus subsp. abscessus]MBN7555221.1 hypothetical protein [Mycobacteroides abscessus subsp. abscessus]MDM2404613.1 hypothetical protein [Mycobacteroides abscessus]